jgi:signal transduction histidine kinase
MNVRAGADREGSTDLILYKDEGMESHVLCLTVFVPAGPSLRFMQANDGFQVRLGPGGILRGDDSARYRDSGPIKEDMNTQVEKSSEGIPVEDLCRQKSIFCVITIGVLAVLLALHVIFATILGRPSLRVIILLGIALALTMSELIWLRKRRTVLTEKAVKIESGASIVGAFALAALLTYITDRDESPYFVLLAIPILQCAYVFGLFHTLLTIVAVDGMIFFWLWHFFKVHPPARVSQYLEGGMLSVIYMQMGLLVWLLVNRLKSNQIKLSATLTDLKATRERLISEEKLAAVGRLAGGVAHEIRNPVAMISSSLSTASHPETKAEVRDEMFAIAAHESRRLEHLTADFLTYARPSLPERSPVLMRDLLSYISSVTKAHAAKRSITLACDLTEDIPFEIDISQVEGALLNLVLNAVDASNEGGIIKLDAAIEEDMLRIDVQNSGPPIDKNDVNRIFEPFFTTKPTGTGLGLAIARGAARAHGGDLWLSSNDDGNVTFSMSLRRAALNSN